MSCRIEIVDDYTKEYNWLIHSLIRYFEIVPEFKRSCRQQLNQPTILQNVLSLVLQIFLNLEAFECNTTSDWLNHTVYPIKSYVTFKFTKSKGKKKKTKGVLENVWWIRALVTHNAFKLSLQLGS